MHDCCLICKHLEYKKNYVYPYRCLKHKAERFSEQELERIVSPVGLEIKAETPAEIAISITGQMIEVRADRKAAAK